MEERFNAYLEYYVILANNIKKIPEIHPTVPASLKTSLPEFTRLDTVHKGIEDFYRNESDGYGFEWWTDKENGIGGNIQLAKTMYLFDDPESLGFYEPDTDKDADIRFFHPFDYPTPESYVGFIIKPETIYNSVYYLSIGDYKLYNLDLDFNGYTQMAVEARVYYHWQVVLLYHMGAISIGTTETEAFKTEMPKIFPGWTWENFIEKFEGLRVSKKG